MPIWVGREIREDDGSTSYKKFKMPKLEDFPDLPHKVSQISINVYVSQLWHVNNLCVIFLFDFLYFFPSIISRITIPLYINLTFYTFLVQEQ